MLTGKRRLCIFGCYLALGDGTTIWDVEVSMAERPRGVGLIVVGDLNLDREKTSSQQQDKEIAVVVTVAGLEDIAGHFLLS